MVIKILICLLSIGCTILVNNIIWYTKVSTIRKDFASKLLNISNIISNAENVDRLVDDDSGEYIADGYLLEVYDYFKLCNMIEDLEVKI